MKSSPPRPTSDVGRFAAHLHLVRRVVADEVDRGRGADALQVLEVGAVVVGLTGEAVVGDAVEGRADRPVAAERGVEPQRVGAGTADDDVARAGVVVVRFEPVVARPAVEQVGAALALQVVVAVLAVELDAVARGVVVVGLGEVVAVAEVDDHGRVGPGTGTTHAHVVEAARPGRDVRVVVERGDVVRPSGDVAPVDREEVGLARIRLERDRVRSGDRQRPRLRERTRWRRTPPPCTAVP